MQGHLDVFVPVLKPFFQFEEDWFECFEPSLDELIHFLNNTQFKFEFFSPTLIKASVYQSYKADKRLDKNWRVNETSRNFDRFCFLHLEIPYEITSQHKELLHKWNPDKKFSRSTVNALMLHGLCTEIKARIADIFIAISIAKPGSIFFQDKGLIFNKTTLIYELPKNSIGLREVKDEIKKLGWPIFLDLEISNTWEWLARFPERNNKSNRIERALAAYSYLFTDTSTSQDTSLIWAIMGIEALYTSGQMGLLNQIKEKSELILGKPKKYKNKLSAMYAFRSKLIHGAANFSRNHYERDYESFDREYGESSDLAIAILISTFQYLIKNNIHQFEFGYKLIDTTQD